MSALTLSTPTAEIIILLVLLDGRLIAVAFGFFDMLANTAADVESD